MIDISKKVTETWDEGLFEWAVFLDFKKTLDADNYKVILAKLAYCGIRNNSQSNTKLITCGVPQSSLFLGNHSLLFVLMIPSAKSSQVYNFTDDNNIPCADKSLKEPIECSLPELFLGKGVLKISSKFTGELGQMK